MTPEETFNQQVWTILQEIKEENLATGRNKPVKYRFGHFVGAGIIPRDRTESILLKLQEWDALKVRDNPFVPPIPADDEIYLDILQPKFDEIYKKYRELCNSERDSDDITKISITDSSTFKNIPIKVLITDLTSKYHEIEKETNQTQFFIKIAHYGQYILEDEAAISVLRPLYQESKDDAKPYIHAYEEFIKEWEDYAKDLLENAKIAGIEENPNNPLDNDASRVKNGLNLIDKKEDPSLWDFGLDYFFTPYQYLVWKFNKIDKSDLLIPKHFDKGSQELKIHPFYSNARDEWDKFKYSREAKVWWAHYQVCRLATGILDLKERAAYFKDDNIIDGFYKYEFSELARGGLSGAPIVLHKNKYEVWIKRLHEYLIPRLENFQNEEKVVLQKQNEPSEKLATPSIPVKDARLDGQNYFLELNNGEEIISFKSKKKGEGLEKETKQFKVLFHLWEFRWEFKNGKVLKKGEFVSLDNLAKASNSESTEAAYKHIQRLNTLFKSKGVAIEIMGENEKYRLIINKA